MREPTAGPKPPTDLEMAAIVAAIEEAWPKPLEMAAIVAAIEEAWPKPTVEEDVAQTADAVWKFANRWWQGAGVLQRGRPRRPRSF